MTAQAPDILINDHPQIDFKGLYLYGIIRGDIHSNHGWGEKYQFRNPPKPPKDALNCSANWRGYVATFVLNGEGELALVEYRYPLSLLRAQTQTVKETLVGDFWMVMKPAVAAPRTYVPFRNGRIIKDRSAWFQDPKAQRYPGPAADGRTGSTSKRLVTADPDVHNGAAVFTRTKVPVERLFEFLASGRGLDEFLADNSSVTREHAVAVLEKAKPSVIRDE